MLENFEPPDFSGQAKVVPSICRRERAPIA